MLETIDLDTSAVKLLINPSGRFDVGGPQGDAGLTGRKIIVDTYGGASRHGGGAFSGEGPVEGRPIRRVRDALGREERGRGRPRRPSRGPGRVCDRECAPVGLYVEAFGTEHAPVERIAAAISSVFDLRPAAIIEDLDLLRPIYAKTATYGHFGRELPEFTWERTDRAEALREAAGL